MAEFHLCSQFGSQSNSYFKCLAHKGNKVDDCGSLLIPIISESPGEAVTFPLDLRSLEKSVAIVRDLFQVRVCINGD